MISMQIFFDQMYFGGVAMNLKFSAKLNFINLYVYKYQKMH